MRRFDRRACILTKDDIIIFLGMKILIKIFKTEFLNIKISRIVTVIIVAIQNLNLRALQCYRKYI